MNKLGASHKLLIVVIVVAGIVASFFIWFSGNQGMSHAPAVQNLTQNSSSTNATGTTAAAGSTERNQNAGATVAKGSVAIKLITPVPNDQWKIGQQNPIAWDKEANFKGEIDLLDSQGKKTIGVILSETGPHQTSYAWDTRFVAVSRYNNLKNSVTPGVYRIKISFDGNNIAPVVSAPFTVTE